MTILVRQKKLALFLVVAMLFSMIPFGAFSAVPQKGVDQIVTFSIGDKSYQKGGAIVGTDVAPYIKDNRTMVPVAFVAPALGTDKAVWIPESQMVRITRGDDLIMIKIGSRELVVNGKVMMMDTAAEIKDIGGGGGRTMLPISFIARALGVGYQWNNQTRSVDFYGYSETFANAGTYGPASGSETIAGNVFVTAPGVRLQNKVIKGDLIIAESVGTGDVFLDNITVEGNTYVRGGGKNSIHINGGSYKNVIIEDTHDGGTRVVATNTDGINIVVATAQAGEQVILEGTFANVEVTAANANVTTQGQTTIQNMIVNNTATVNVAAGTTVNTVTLNAAATVAGEGTVTNANVNVSGSTVATEGTIVNTAAGVTPPATTTITTPVVTPTGGGGGGGGGGDDSPSSPTAGTLDITPLYYFPPGGTTSVSNSISISGTTFTDAVTNTGNWTINMGTTNLVVDTITKTGASSVTIDYSLATAGQGTGAGTITYIAKAAAVANGVDSNQGSTTIEVDETELTVTSAAEFSAAIGNNNTETIILGNDITGNVTGTRTGATNLTISFGNFVLTGDLTITANSITALNLTGSSSPAINGSMTITAGNATVTNGILVSGAINVVDTGDDSWIEQVDDNTIIVTDDNGASIVIQGNPADITIGTGANGITITASTPVAIIVNSGATVTNINATAPGTTITNNGTVTSVTADADVLIENNSGDIAVTGTGTAGVTGTASGNVTGTYVVVITDISGDLTVSNPTLKVGGTTTADITFTLHAPSGEEYINVTSSAPGVVSVDSLTGVGITANARGRAIITVKIFNSSGTLIKMGTIPIDVLPANITSAPVTMTAPAAGGTPQTGAQVESATGNADYTVSSVTWNQALTAAGKFKAGEVYSATVVLTSKNNKAFPAGVDAPTPTVAGSSSVTGVTDSGMGVGNRLTFTVTFPATAAKVVTGIQVTTQPTKMTYTEDSDDVLALNGMVITETYNDGTTGTVTFADGTAAGYTADPANGANLTVVANNGNPVVITHTASSETANTGNLTVNIPVLTGSPVFSSGAPPTFGTPLVVGPGTLNVTTNLTHAWYRSDNNTFEEGTDISVSDPNGDTYVPVAGDVGKYIIVVVTSTDASGSATLTVGVPVGKAAGPAAPDAPTLATKTTTTVVLNTILGAEYNIDGGSWQDSPEFTGLTPSTLYAFGTRIKETATHLASATSDALNVITEAEPPVLVTGITVTGAGSATEVSVGQTLQMNASILPADATEQGVTWSVVNGTGTGAINGSTGLFTGTGEGTVTVKATANDGSGIEETLIITVTEAVNTAPEGLLLDAKGGAGFVGMVYSRSGNVYYNQVSTAGVWAGEALLGTGSEGRMDLDTSGYPHVVYTTADGKIAYRAYDGSQWDEAILIESNNAGTCSKPDLALDSSGNAHLTYTDTMGEIYGLWDYEDIMYANNSAGSFTKAVIRKGYRDNSTSPWFIYRYLKGSNITVDSSGQYIITLHRYEQYRDSGLPAVTTHYYGIEAVSLGASGIVTNNSTNSTDTADLFESQVQNTKSFVMYKERTPKISELQISGANINFVNDLAITLSTLKSFNTDGTNIVAAGTNGGKLETQYNSYKSLHNDIEISNNGISVIKTGGSFYAIYTDNSDGIIKSRVIDVPPILVTGITVTGAGDATEVTFGETLQMSAEVLPADAEDQSITWSVVNGTGSGTIDASGLLTATGAGTLTVKAIANDSSGVEGTLAITVNKAASIASPTVPTVDAGTPPTDDTITLTELNGPELVGQEYAISSIGGTPIGSPSWQSSRIFTGLVADTEYKFITRIAESGNHLPSEASAESAVISTEAETVSLSQITGATVGLRSGSIIMGHSFNGGDVSYTQAISDTYGLDLANSNVSFAIFDGTNYVATGNTVALSALSLSDSDQPGESAKVTFADFQTMLSTFGLTMADPAQIPTHVKVVVRSKTTIGGVAVSNPWGPIDSGWILIDSGLVPDLVDPTNSSASIEVGNKTAGAEFPVTINIKDSDNNNSPDSDYGVMILVGETPVGGGSISFTDGQATVNALIASAGTVNILVKVNDITVDTIADVVVVNPPILDVIETTFDGTKIMLTFDKNMADPVGKHEQFTVSVNGSGNAVTAAALNSVDAKTIDLTLTTALSGGETITIAYTKGTVAAADGGLLNTFTPVPVTNNVGDSDATEVTTVGTHYSVTVHGSSMIPADNPITANTTPITTDVTVGTFLGNLEFPYGASYKVANASTILGSFETWNFDTITGKNTGDSLAVDDLLLVLAEDGTTLRGYHITVTAPAPEALTVSAVTTGSDTVKLTFNKTITNVYNLEGYVIPEGITVSSRGIELDGTDYYYYVESTSGTPHIFLLDFDLAENWVEVTINGAGEDYTAYVKNGSAEVVASDTFALDWTGLAYAGIHEIGSPTTSSAMLHIRQYVDQDDFTGELMSGVTIGDITVFGPELFGISAGDPFFGGYYTIQPTSGEFASGFWLRFNRSGYRPDYRMMMLDEPSGTLTIFSTNPEGVTAAEVGQNVTVVVTSSNIPDATEVTLSLHRGTPGGEVISTETGTISSNTATINFSVPNTLEAGHFYFVVTAGEVTSDGDLLVVGPSDINSTVSVATDPASPLVDNAFTIEVGLRDAIGTIVNGIDGAYFTVTPWLANTSTAGSGLVTIDSVVQDPGSGNYIITARYSAEETIDLQVGALNVLVGTIEDVSVVVPDAVVDIAAVGGVTVPVTGGSPVTTVTETDQYTGTVSWGPTDDPFAAETPYTATITLTAKAGYTFTGVAENFFTVVGADTVTNPADSGTITAIFPATGPNMYNLTIVGPKTTTSPVPGSIADGTEITVTVSPAAGQSVVAFSVGGINKLADLNGEPSNQYIFNIVADTAVSTTIQLAQVSQPVWSGNTITWTDVDDALEYAVSVYKDDVSVGGFPVAPGVQAYDISGTINTNGLGSYTVFVRANANTGLGYWHGGSSTASEALVIDTDNSGFSVSLADPGDKLSGSTFNLSITGATETLGNPLNYGIVNVTVNSDIDGEVYNSNVDFNAGSATIPLTLTTSGAHTLTVTVARTTGSETVAVNVTEG